MVRGENEEAAALVLGRLLQGVRFRSGLHFFLFRLLWVYLLRSPCNQGPFPYQETGAPPGAPILDSRRSHCITFASGETG